MRSFCILTLTVGLALGGVVGCDHGAKDLGPPTQKFDPPKGGPTGAPAGAPNLESPKQK
jgi:hypothetical protein